MAPKANFEERLDTELKTRYDFIDLTNSDKNPFIKNEDDDELIYSKSPTIGVVEQRKIAELQEINSLLTMEECKAIMRIYVSALERVMKENGKEF